MDGHHEPDRAASRLRSRWRSKARTEPEWRWHLPRFGQKIFITYGEHDITDNLVHLVLARLPDAPAGVRGISLFLVPKFLVNADGSLGKRNDVKCAPRWNTSWASTVRRLASMIYGDGFAPQGGEPGAIGWLVGEENKGLACMFTMMNNARLAVGMQGMAIAEACVPEGGRLCEGSSAGQSAGYSGEGMAADHPSPGRSAQPDDHAGADPPCARAISYAAHTRWTWLPACRRAMSKRKGQYRANLLTPDHQRLVTD
jgi:acyl-CoA dehydrogenase